MDKTAIMAEISAQSKLVDSIPIDKALVTEIDRHIKDIENKLNERLVHIPAKFIIQNYLPEINKRGDLAVKVDDELWESFYFGKNWYAQKETYEEISFEKQGKDYSFYYTIGEVIFDLGVVEFEGVDWYARVSEDNRKTHKLTGSTVEIKLRAFQHLKELLIQINEQANQMTEHYRDGLTQDALEEYPGMQVVGSWNNFFESDPLSESI